MNHPLYSGHTFREYEFQEYPRMVYPGAENPKKPYSTEAGKGYGKPLPGVIVNDEEEESRALKLSQHFDAKHRPGNLERGGETVQTMAKGVHRLVSEEDRRASLIQEADNLGVQIDKRWKADRIEAAIEAHKSASDVV